MTTLPPEGLRALVREALLDALPGLAADLATRGGAPVDGSRWVTVGDDDDLARLVAEVVRLADDPRDGPRLRSGELRFRLSQHHTGTGPPASGAAAPAAAATARERRVERGPVTERHVREAEGDGVRRLVLGPGAVLTPMARDRARGAGVEIVRENVRQSGRNA